MNASTETVITTLATRGITLKAEGDRIRAHGALDDEARILIRTHKARLLAALAVVTTPTRETLEQTHPAIVLGIPLSVVLDHADPSDYPDLVDMAALEAFTASLIATGTLLDPTQCREALKQALPRPKRPMVRRCCDCRHFIPSPTDPRHGVGGCRVDSPAQMHPDVWPATERFCGEFATKEAQP